MLLSNLRKARDSSQTWVQTKSDFVIDVSFGLRG